jgi:hypothetical protein
VRKKEMTSVDTNADAANGVLIPELADYRGQFEALKGETAELLDGLTEAQFNWRERPGRWSIAECLVHLNVTARLYLPLIESAMKEARSRQLLSDGPFRHGFLVNWLIRTTEPPPKLKTKSPKIFVPPPDQPLETVATDFMTLQDQFLARIQEANGLHLSRIKVISPVSRFLRMSLGQSFAFLAAHERRHLWQAREVKAGMRAEG